MKIRRCVKLLPAIALLGLLAGCNEVGPGDMEEQLDRRQLDTYEEESPTDPVELDEADPTVGDREVGAVEATGGQ